MRHRRARHSGGPLGCLHAIIGFVACVGFAVGASNVATDPAVLRVEPSSQPAIVEPARVELTTRPTLRPTPHRTARPTARVTPDPAGELERCLIDQGIDPDTLDIETIDPAEYDC